MSNELSKLTQMVADLQLANSILEKRVATLEGHNHSVEPGALDKPTVSQIAFSSEGVHHTPNK